MAPEKPIPDKSEKLLVGLRAIGDKSYRISRFLSCLGGDGQTLLVGLRNRIVKKFWD